MPVASYSPVLNSFFADEDMADDVLPPLILCMENASGEDVALRIEPDDDFQSFLVKAKSLLGFEVDINTITRDQPVLLNDNIYQFLMNAEQSNPQNQTTELNLEILEDNASSDFVYILDDGTQINASQIHFDNDEPPIDLTLENLPFVKYREDNDETEESIIDNTAEMKQYNIVGSPVSRRPRNASPKRSFASTLPFRVLSSKAKNFEVQIKRYLERAPKVDAPIAQATKFPEIVVQRDDQPENAQEEKTTSERDEADVSFTREQVLNMFKDSPVAANFSDDTAANVNEKRRHVRKTDPSRPVPKKTENTQVSYADVEETCSEQIGSRNCFMCNKYVNRTREKLYIFDKEDQKLHRSSPQLKLSTQLKVLCENCLKVNFKPGILKSPEKSLDADEYLVIRNNQQYIFRRITTPVPDSFVDDAKAIIDKVETEVAQDKDVEFVKIEIGSDGEIISKSVDNKLNEEVVVIKEEVPENPMSAQAVDTLDRPIDDGVIDDLEEEDDDVKEFLGKCQEDVADMKCRFCQREFLDLSQVIEHGSEHKHSVDDGEVFPCPLCDYGYVDLKWLKAHLNIAHDPTKKSERNEIATDLIKITDNESEDATSRSSPIATRTRSSTNKKKDSGNEKDKSENEDTEKMKSKSFADNEHNGPKTERPDQLTPEVFVTEVKQEPVDLSDEEAIWIVQAGDGDSDVNDDQLKEILSRVKAQENCHEATMFCSIKDTHQCPTCKQLFISEETLKAHKCMKRRGRKRKSDCPYVPSQDDAKKHRKKRGKQHSSDPQVVTCHDCSESFTSKVRLKFHMQFHEETPLLTHDRHYQCWECGDSSVFGTETELFDHVHFQHPKQRRWQCPVSDCGKTFYLRATLTKHSRSHTDTRRYVCPSCGKRFLDKQTLDEHGVTHLQIKPYQCHICLKQLTRRSRLRMHLRAHEEELAPALVLVCCVCARAFKDAAAAQEHGCAYTECIKKIATELKEDEEEGPRIDLSPSSGLITETNPREEKDEQAFRRAALKRTYEPLDRERANAMMEEVSDEARPLMRVVEIEKAFRCEYCEDVFYLEDSLNAHRSIHKGVKNPFTCHICKVTFATYSRCTTHKTTHGFYKRSLADVKRQAEDEEGGQGATVGAEGDVPTARGILGYGGFPVVKHFLCEDCGRSYLHWTYLQVHRRMKHPDQNLVYQCAQCHLTFPNSWSVSYHKKKVHSNMQGEGSAVKKTHDYWIPCRDCEEVLPNKNALYKHRSKEHSDMSLCDTNKAAESQPRRAHSCYVCGHSFRTAAVRNEHLRVHTGERPHACHLCGLTFRRMTALRNHRLVHSGRAQQCPRCPRRFRQREALYEHVRVRHPNQVHVIEIPGLSPSPEEVLHHLKKNNIPPDKIVNLTKISFLKGSARVVPQTEGEMRALMERHPQNCGPWRRRVMAHIAPHRLPASQGSDVSEGDAESDQGVAHTQHRPNILQRSSEAAQANTSYPITLNIPGEEISDAHVQLLMPDGVLVNGTQMVRMQANKGVLRQCARLAAGEGEPEQGEEEGHE